MASSVGMKDIFKEQTLNEPKLLQLDRGVFSNVFQRKPVTEPVIILKIKHFDVITSLALVC
jgi:hypothetical protein